MTCAYCELPQIKARTIIANELAWAFPTNIPIVPGHTLIAPKRCVVHYEDMTKAEQEAVEALRQKICGALVKTFGAEGFNFAWNDGKDCGQSVPHFHLHVLPRKKGDTGVYEYEPRKFLYRPGDREATPEAELAAIASLIQKAL